MSLQRRREKLIILSVWKIRHRRAPNDINLQFFETNKKSNKAVVRPMPKVRGKLLSQYENSFVVKAAKLWNKLPDTVSKIDSFEIFQRRLDAYLKLYPDNPPIKAYYHVNKNSLLEYNTMDFNDSEIIPPLSLSTLSLLIYLFIYFLPCKTLV